jgi:hypothetical protein
LAENSNERATLLILVPSASIGFGLAFNLGAFGVVFFDRILVVWVMSTIVFIASLVSKLPPRKWWGRLALLIPTMWLVLTFLDASVSSTQLDSTLSVTAIVVTVVCLPVIAWTLISSINQEFLELPRRNRTVIVLTVLLFATAGWALGANNDRFLYCDDFQVSGNDLPSNCVQASDTP